MARKCFPELPAKFLTGNPTLQPPRKSNSSVLALAGWSSMPPHNGPSNIIGKMKYLNLKIASLRQKDRYQITANNEGTLYD